MIERFASVSRICVLRMPEMIYEKQLLTELMEVFEENEKDVFTTAELVDALLRKNADWRYTSGGQAINTRWLALRLGSYNLKSIRTRVNGVQIRVYSTEDMKKAFANYLSVDEIEKTNDVAPSEVADLASDAADLKQNVQIVNDCLEVAQKLRIDSVSFITPKEYAALLKSKKMSWKPKGSGN